ncbi:glycosyltransferase [Pelagibacterium sp. H642]|uniref:glycosyltransferase n=1 Tax=Pelagibacterium sp. H642 TaxID=1881069 RepID=UPI00281516BA|nr:glycosyltransferase [Pelagibacterium sp. H642]WMT92940.1 glycosyltransferase [Pelagibacterium sp. H642]
MPCLGLTPDHTVEFDEKIDYDEHLSSGVPFSWIQLFRELVAGERYHAAVLYNPSNALSLLLRIMTLVRDIHAALDITEWYEYDHLSSWRAKAEVFLRMNISYKLFSRMIFITEYLSRCYNPRIGKVIPPLVERPARGSSTKNMELVPLKILYAGFPGKKDRIDLLIAWINKVNFPHEIQLILAGPRADELDLSSSAQNFQIVALGPVDRETVFQLYRECHISAIIRDDARYEWAGFPTKSVEGWSLGVPVLVMSHSHFAKRAREYGAAAVIEASDPVGSLERVLWKIYLEGDYLDKMRAASFRLSRDHHQVAGYVTSMDDIVS